MKTKFYIIAFSGIILSALTVLIDQSYLGISYNLLSSFFYFFIGPYVFLVFVKSVFKFKQPFKFFLTLSTVFIVTTIITHLPILFHTGPKGWGFYAIPAIVILLFQYLTIGILALMKIIELYKLKKSKIT